MNNSHPTNDPECKWLDASGLDDRQFGDEEHVAELLRAIGLVGFRSLCERSIVDHFIGRERGGDTAASGLRDRRQRLGATVSMMAGGLGLQPDAINAIENGTASREMTERYERWLSIMEGWPADKLAAELLLANKGRMFHE